MLVAVAVVRFATYIYAGVSIDPSSKGDGGSSALKETFCWSVVVGGANISSTMMTTGSDLRQAPRF